MLCERCKGELSVRAMGPKREWFCGQCGMNAAAATTLARGEELKRAVQQARDLSSPPASITLTESTRSRPAGDYRTTRSSESSFELTINGAPLVGRLGCVSVGVLLVLFGVSKALSLRSHWGDTLLFTFLGLLCFLPASARSKAKIEKVGDTLSVRRERLFSGEAHFAIAAIKRVEMEGNDLYVVTSEGRHPVVNNASFREAEFVKNVIERHLRS